MAERTEGASTNRLVSLDAYRGFVMLAMASGGLALQEVAEKRPGQLWLGLLAIQAEHVVWRGCTFWDLIQPSFLFLVGAAMPFSYAVREARGEAGRTRIAHVASRSFLLVALGVFLSSAWSRQTNFVFTNVLCQIGLGYPFLYALFCCSTRTRLFALIVILVGYWGFFAWYPIPSVDYPFHEVGVRGDFEGLRGFLAHWGKNTNPAAAFDRWLLNVFPRPDSEPFRYNEGGYATLNFIPSIATMLLGVLAGDLLRSGRSAVRTLRILIIAGAVGIVVGTMLDTTLCPVVKRIWTPSWVLYSAGWASWMLAVFHALTEVVGWRRWAFPLVVVGANSIAFYVMAQLMKPWTAAQLKIHLTPLYQVLREWNTRGAIPIPIDGPWLTAPFAGDFGPLHRSVAILLVFWLIALGMYRRRIFIRL
ncbi:MAG: DUF5009 domain-containing protein [Isosphaeraceae bacterium]